MVRKLGHIEMKNVELKVYSVFCAILGNWLIFQLIVISSRVSMTALHKTFAFFF